MMFSIVISPLGGILIDSRRGMIKGEHNPRLFTSGEAYIYIHVYIRPEAVYIYIYTWVVDPCIDI